MTKRLPQDHSRIKRDVSLEARASGLNLHHMLDLADHAAHIGRVLKFHCAVPLVEPETDQGRALVLGAADRRSGLRYLDLRHRLTPPPPRPRPWRHAPTNQTGAGRSD